MILAFWFCLALAVTANAMIRVSDSNVIPSVSEGAQPGMPGGKSVSDIKSFDNYDQVARLAQEAIRQMDEKNVDSDAVHYLIRVKEAASAVVSGFMHELVFYFGECKPGTKTNRNNEPLAIRRETASPDGTEHTWIVKKVCEEKTDGKYGICWAKVLEQSWLNKTELFDSRAPYQCKNVPRDESYAV